MSIIKPLTYYPTDFGKQLAATIDLPPIVVPTTVLVQRPPEAWGEGR